MSHSRISMSSGAGAAALMAFQLAAGPVLAASFPSNLADLSYQDSSYGEREMRSRGYTLVHSDFRNGTMWQYWWKGSNSGGNRKCVKVGVLDGKFSSMDGTSRTDCNQYYSDGDSSDEMSDATKAAIAAAAILGVAALAHQSHERDGRHGESSQSIADFDRGYRDGMYHAPYHNYDNSRAYSDGYSEGMQQRSDQTRHHASHSGDYSGYRQYVNVNNLVGERAAGADSTLRNRGFRDVGGHKTKNASFVSWWNPGTRQCIEVKTKEGRIKAVNNVSEGHCTG